MSQANRLKVNQFYNQSGAHNDGCAAWWYTLLLLHFQPIEENNFINDHLKMALVQLVRNLGSCCSAE